MPLYSVAYAGSTRETIEVKAAFVNAANENIARAKANRMAQSTFPPRKGYNAHYVDVNEIAPPKFGQLVWAVAYIAARRPENLTTSVLSLAGWTSGTDRDEYEILGEADMLARKTFPTAQSFQFSIKCLGWFKYRFTLS